MELTRENKVNILSTLLEIVGKEHPEFCEENTTGWDMLKNGKIWLQELKINKNDKH